ncbi:MAG: hydrogenase/urease maturation nickel metallochaperone HypA [archaeon]
MHDVSVSDSIVKAVAEKAKEFGDKKVLNVEASLGELMNLEPEKVQFWLKELFEKELGYAPEVKVNIVPAKLICDACGYDGNVEYDKSLHEVHAHDLICPQCGEQMRIIKGRECCVDSIEFEQ